MSSAEAVPPPLKLCPPAPAKGPSNLLEGRGGKGKGLKNKPGMSEWGEIGVETPSGCWVLPRGCWGFPGVGVESSKVASVWGGKVEAGVGGGGEGDEQRRDGRVRWLERE